MNIYWDFTSGYEPIYEQQGSLEEDQRHGNQAAKTWKSTS